MTKIGKGEVGCVTISRKWDLMAIEWGADGSCSSMDSSHRVAVSIWDRRDLRPKPRSLGGRKIMCGESV